LGQQYTEVLCEIAQTFATGRNVTRSVMLASFPGRLTLFSLSLQKESAQWAAYEMELLWNNNLLKRRVMMVEIATQNNH